MRNWFKKQSRKYSMTRLFTLGYTLMTEVFKSHLFLVLIDIPVNMLLNENVGVDADLSPLLLMRLHPVTRLRGHANSRIAGLPSFRQCQAGDFLPFPSPPSSSSHSRDLCLYPSPSLSLPIASRPSPVPVPFSFPFLPCPFHFPFPSLPLKPARGSEGALWALPAGSGAEPQPKLNLVHFMHKIWQLLRAISESIMGNDRPDLLQKQR